MVEFVQDDDRLREERKKAKKNKDKYIGVSSDSMEGFKQTNCKWRLLSYSDFGFGHYMSIKQVINVRLSQKLIVCLA